MTNQLTRRRFVQTSAAAAALAANPYFSPAALMAEDGKNERPLVGAIGLGGQGTGIARRASGYGDMVAVCDVQRQHAERAKEKHFDKAEYLRRLSQVAGSQGYRGGHHRHARPLAHDHCPGGP